jgi:hypothetical protein
VGRVSGCGFGCTLIRRQVLETIPFRPGGQAQAPDMPFALDCVRKEVLQLARFDVMCGHIHKGATLEISSMGDGLVTVNCIQSVNVIVNGGGMALIEGESYEMLPDNAKELASLGYVEIGEASPKARKPSIGDVGDEHIAAPKVPRR